MILNLKKKEQVVNNIHKVAKKAVSAVVATLEGIEVNEINQLRREARDIGVSVHVVRNTLLRRVIEGTSFLCLKDVFFGPNIIGFASENPSDSVRIFFKFSNKNKNFKIKGAAFEGKFVDISQINFLLNLPTYTESLFHLVKIMKMNSIGNLIRMLHVLSIKRQELQ